MVMALNFLERYAFDSPEASEISSIVIFLSLFSFIYLIASLTFVRFAGEIPSFVLSVMTK